MTDRTVQQAKTTCCYCGVGCGILATKDRKGRLSVQGDPDHPVNKGMLCSKGMNLHYTVMDQSDRLLYPEMRWHRDGPLNRISWDTALNRAAAVFKSIIEKHGPDSVAFYVSGQMLTEEYYLVNKLSKGFIGTNNIDTNSRLCMSSAVVGYKMSLGEDSVPVSYEDIELADCFYITGANPAWCHPILFRRLEEHKSKNPNVRVIVADPRKTQTCSIADIHLQLSPGTDIVLNYAIARCLIEKDLIDNDFIDNHTEGYEQLKSKVFERSLQEAASICDVPIQDIEKTAEMIGCAKGFISMWAMGLNQSVIGVNKNLSLINLNLITGKIGKPGSGPFSLTGQPNAMGGREVGGLSNLLPAHRLLNNPDHRKEVASFWKVGSISDKPGFTATEMFDELEKGKLKAIWIICTNPLVSIPNARKVESALKNARFVVVQDCSKLSDSLKYADLILPAASWLEKQGTMTNSERRISLLSKLIDPPGEALPDSEILCKFAEKMGFGSQFRFNSSSEVYQEHCQLTKGTNIDISRLDYSILSRVGTVQWPYFSGQESGTKRLFEDKQFFTPSKKAKIHAPEDNNQSEPISPDLPLILTTGRIRDQWHTMTKTGKVKKLQQHIDNALVEIHPEDAAERGIKNGHIVKVFNGRGEVEVKAKVTSEIKKGVVFLPMHWGKILGRDILRANNLTPTLIDPISKEPDFKYSPVQVSTLTQPVSKIVVVGAGSASYKFIQSYRELNQADNIIVFSKENIPFYNRILLPDYINGDLQWERLQKTNQDELLSWNIDVKSGISIEGIDRRQKTIIDSQGNIHTYDKLILATGSSASKPHGFNDSLKGVYTLRDRKDADEIRKTAERSKHAVILGGGLLGIECASAIRKMGLDVTLVQRSSKLMGKQLDQIASDLLLEEILDKDITVLFNDELDYFIGEGKVTEIVLSSGRRIPSDLVIFGIGTQPNLSLAKLSGLRCSQGILVDEHLQTSDGDIFAIGEIAEYQQQLYGTTLAAEEQAQVVANVIAGDLSSVYHGSIKMNILKVDGVILCSLGLTEVPSHDPAFEEVIFLDKARRYYKKCVVYKDKLVGAIFMGDNSEFSSFKSMIEDGIELADQRFTLLMGTTDEDRKLKGTLVCSCNQVGVENILQEIEKGTHHVDMLCNKTGAGMGCGSCKPEVKTILNKALETKFSLQNT